MTQTARVHGRSLEPASAPTSTYEGLITRAIAFAFDASIINLFALVVGAAIGQALTVLSISDTTEKVLYAVGGVAYVTWSISYFVTFWASTGQTPGSRLLRIRVCRASDGRLLRPRKALLRYGAMILAAIPLGAGFLPILFDNRRRGLHDMLAGSVVVTAPPKVPMTARPRRVAPR